MKKVECDYTTLFGVEVDLLYGLIGLDDWMECIGWLGEYLYMWGIYFIGYCGKVWTIC